MSTTDITTQVLAGMWTENTGRHFLDSGGAYGRSWERNQAATAGVDAAEYFLSLPQVTLDASYNYVDITVSAFHWLNEILDYSPKLNRMFEMFVALEGEDGRPWMGEAEAFVEWLEQHGRASDVQTVNTYNGETWLDSTLQYVVFTYTDRDGFDADMVMLQYHGGCDVRGGYTKPRAFSISGYEGRYELYTEGHVSLSCTENYGQEIGVGLDGDTVYAGTHAWDSNSSGVDWVEYGGAYDTPDFETIEPEDDSTPYVACPTCKAPLEVSVNFGH